MPNLEVYRAAVRAELLVLEMSKGVTEAGTLSAAEWAIVTHGFRAGLPPVSVAVNIKAKRAIALRHDDVLTTYHRGENL